MTQRIWGRRTLRFKSEQVKERRSRKSGSRWRRVSDADMRAVGTHVEESERHVAETERGPQHLLTPYSLSERDPPSELPERQNTEKVKTETNITPRERGRGRGSRGVRHSEH